MLSLAITPRATPVRIAIGAIPEQDVAETNMVGSLRTSKLHECSMDDDVVEQDSVELPSLLSSRPESRGRRRSELARVRGGDPVMEAIELPVLTERPPLVATTSFDKAGILEDSSAIELPSSASTIFQDPEIDTTSLSSSQKAYHNRRSWIYFFANVWCFFMQGWNDGSTGPLLLRFQKYYGVGFAVISLLFVLSFVGYLSGALVNVWLDGRWGFGKIIVFGACCQTMSYIIMSTGGPFPIMVLGYCVAGFGMALQNAQGNGLVTCFRDAPTKLGLLHAGYGLGALTAPLVATQFSTMAEKWNRYYIISAGLSFSNAVTLYHVFRFTRQYDILLDAGHPVGELNVVRGNVFKQIFKLPALHSLAIFSVIYVGIEVTLGGWIVTFIEEVRGAGSNAGYISSGFFGGLMLGRICLIWLNRKVGPRRVLFIYLLLAIQLEVTIWLVPSLIENAIAVSLIGLLLGPMYPIMLNHSTQILPRWLLTPSIGWIAATGQAGSALLPFITGILSNKFGIMSLQPFIVSMMSTLLVLWAIVPRTRTMGA